MVYGYLKIVFEDCVDVYFGFGEFCVVLCGVCYFLVVDEECGIMLIEMVIM